MPLPSSRAVPNFFSSSRWLTIASLWVVFGLLNATQIVIAMRSEGMHHPWTRLFVTVVLSWLVWVLATPFIEMLGNRFPPISWRPASTWLVHLFGCTAIGLAFAFWGAWLRAILNPFGEHLPQPPIHVIAFDIFLYEFHIIFLLYAAILFLGYHIESRRNLALREAEAARLNEELTRAQLQALRRQLEPHFLFNTLNAIAGLVRESRNNDAVSMIARLSDLLRNVLAGTAKQMVPLRDELDLLEKYLEIQKTRFADRLEVSIEVQEELLDTLVPSLMFQPMVENAIQHGVAKRVNGGVVHIKVSRDRNSLHISICNNGPALPPEDQAANTGVGIANIRNRLKTLYGEEHLFEVRNCPTGGVEVQIILPSQARAAA